MNHRSVTIITAAILLISGGAYYAHSSADESQLPIQATKEPVKKPGPSAIQLEIVIDGGFAYIPSGTNTLNIAYLNDWKYTGANDLDPETPATTVFCDVKQMGTKLQVKNGDVVVPGPTQTEFDLDGAVVTFPALQGSSAGLSATRPRRTSSPFKPGNANDPNHWVDLRFISSLRSEHGAKLNPKWKGIVNGAMVVRGGSLKALKPGKFAGSTFEFRRSGKPQFEQSMSDRTLYAVEVMADQIEIELDTDSGVQKIVVRPKPGPTRTVELALTGIHNMIGGLPVGAELTEHCTFYQLFDPVPQPATWLRPHLMAPHTAVLQPHSPGFFCPGEWF
jgi:hypothetical protein